MKGVGVRGEGEGPFSGRWEEDRSVTSPAALGTYSGHQGAAANMDSDMYAQLNFLGLGGLAEHNPESLTRGRDVTEITDDNLICKKSERGLWVPSRRWLLVGNVLLIILLLVVTIILLSLYLQVCSRLRRSLRETEELHLNQSRWQEELDKEQELGLSLRENLSSLLQDHHSLRALTLPQLLHNQTQHLQEIERQERQCQHLRNNFSALQEEYDQLRERHLLTPRESPLLQHCQRRELGSNSSLCYFCPSGWQFFGLSCYLLTSKVHTWEDAAGWCRKQGGYLAVINSAEEQHFLQDLVLETSWIGLSDRDMEGDWRWVDGTPYDSTPKFWTWNQPDNAGNQDCVVLSPLTEWNDDKCRKSYSSVCEGKPGQLSLQGDTLSN